MKTKCNVCPQVCCPCMSNPFKRNILLGLMVFLLQVQVLFLQWIPWLLCMSRPGDQITFKSILMTRKLKEMDKKEIFSKSLLANILDIDDNFCASKFNDNSGVVTNYTHVNPSPNGCFNR